MTWISPSDWWGMADFGTVPDWFVAIGTSAAFIVAAIAFLIDVRSRRAAQARLVYGDVSSAEQHLAGSQIYSWGGIDGTGSIVDIDVAFKQDVLGLRYLTSDSATVFAQITIRNESRELIGPALVILKGRGVAMPEMVLATLLVEPGSSAEAQILCPWANAPDAPQPRALIAFRDSSAKWWTRRGSDPIERANWTMARRFESLARKTESEFR